MDTEKSYLLYDTAGYWLAKLHALLNVQSNSMYKHYDVTSSQLAVLLTLYKGKIKSPHRLAKHIGIDKSAIKRTLNRLEKKGFVMVRKPADNGRLRSVELTCKAKDVVPKLIRLSRKCDDVLFAGLSNEERFMFKAMVNKMLRNFDLSAHI